MAFGTAFYAITLIIALKAVPKAFNSHALTSEKPCINKEFHAPLMHKVFDFSYARFRAILHQYRRSVTFAVEAIDKTVSARVMQIRILQKMTEQATLNKYVSENDLNL